MLIAGKYEEIYPPRIHDYVEITDRAYQKKDVIRMEKQVLSALQFDITVTTSYQFLKRYVRIARVCPLTATICKYALELCLIEVSMNRYMPDMLACSALFFSIKFGYPPE